MKISIACATLSVIASVAARTITVQNHCAFTIWPGVYTGQGEGPSTGWEAPPQSTEELCVPDNWTSGRIWGRRNCDFSKPEVQDCTLGACIGGLECKQPGIPPITLAEFTLRGEGGKDFYDVSLVDGFGIPVKITPSASACHAPECSVDLALDCPDALKGPHGTDGTPLGCKSACVANLDGNPQNSPNCCSGQYDKPETCPPSGVKFYNYFKDSCPDGYAYAYDEASKTALWECEQKHNSDFTVTFCPQK